MTASDPFSSPFQEEGKKQQYELNACALAAVASTLGVYSFQYTMRLTSSFTALSASNFQLREDEGRLKKKERKKVKKEKKKRCECLLHYQSRRELAVALVADS